MKLSKKTALPWLWLAVVVSVIDQVSKFLVLQHLQYQHSVYLTPFLNFMLVYNRGASFGFLSGQGGWQVYFFAIIAAVISVYFIFWLKNTSRHLIARGLGLSLIIGGAIGNMIDRVRLTYVIDFIDFHLREWHFATFNFADCAVTIGAVFLMFSLLKTANNN